MVEGQFFQTNIGDWAGFLGLILTVFAFLEARQAKKSAIKAENAATEALKKSRTLSSLLDVNDIISEIEVLKGLLGQNIPSEILHQRLHFIKKFLIVSRKTHELDKEDQRTFQLFISFLSEIETQFISCDDAISGDDVGRFRIGVIGHLEKIIEVAAKMKQKNMEIMK